ncbi:MAG: hypothetical protein LBK25_01620, partial [Treponema sp.]|nr:hypothetical protein [Treponema sp.]
NKTNTPRRLSCVRYSPIYTPSSASLRLLSLTLGLVSYSPEVSDYGTRVSDDGTSDSYDGTRDSHDGTRVSCDGTRVSCYGTRGSHDGTRGSCDGTRGSDYGTRGSHDGTRGIFQVPLTMFSFTDRRVGNQYLRGVYHGYSKESFCFLRLGEEPAQSCADSSHGVCNTISGI